MATLTLDQQRMGPPLRKRSVCGRLCVVLTLILVFASLIHLSLLASMRLDVTLVFLLALFLSSVLALLPVGLLWFLERRERQSPWLFAAAFFWGGCIATAFALPFNSIVFALVDNWVRLHPAVGEILGPEAATLLSAPLSAPVAEEALKALGVTLVFWLLRDETDGVRDGIIYGALVGLGFNWFEAALYVSQGYAEQGIAPFGRELGGRYALFGFNGHALFSAVFGASLGLAFQTKRGWLRIVSPIVGLVLAIAGHLLNNLLPLIGTLVSVAAGEPPSLEPVPHLGFTEAFLASSTLELTLFAPLYLLLGIALWRSGVWERRAIRDELADEVGRSITRDDYREIVTDHVLRTRRIDPHDPAKSAALVNAQHELGLRKRRARNDGKDPDRDPRASGWRHEILRLRPL